MNYGMAYSPWQGIHRQLNWYSPLKSIWYYIMFGSDLRNLYWGGDCGEKMNKKLRMEFFLKKKKTEPIDSMAH